jgi:RimJ/RimL family protein N-acetyltransferase
MGDVETDRLSLRTDRLVLRQWEAADLDGLARMYSDPQVTRYLGDGRCLTRAETAEMIGIMQRHWDEQGFGLWAATVKESDALIGRIGLAVPSFLPEVLPAVEVGWVLDRAFWGRGLATEGARACLEFGFTTLELDRIISICNAGNVASERVMVKLGMRLERETVHPGLGLPVKVYAISRPELVRA